MLSVCLVVMLMMALFTAKVIFRLHTLVPCFALLVCCAAFMLPGNALHCGSHPRWLLIMMIGLLRVGEASNPGPLAHFDEVFTLGTFNPSGLRNKAQYFTTHLSDGDIWTISETHFFGKDVSKFRAGLRFANSGHRYCVTDRTSLKPCLTSRTSWKGVAAVSRMPTRAIPSAMPQCLQDSGRALMVASLVGDAWVTGAVLYGEPDGHLYPNHVRNNEYLLHHAAAQICHLSTGLRYVAGDFNVIQDSLPSFDILRRAGFRDAQDVAFAKWGQPIVPTCKQTTRKDFLYLSPELQELLLAVHVTSDVWPDHAILKGCFQMPKQAPHTWTWPQPQPMPWPRSFEVHCEWNDQVHPTEAYQQLWKDIETAACQASPFPIPDVMKGRAQRLQPKKVRPNQLCPLKLGRHGDFQPEFVGSPARHAQWLRQTRRLQAFTRLLTSVSDVTIQIVESWGAILRAPGFCPDFPSWWTDCKFRVSGAPAICPLAPPDLPVAQALFDSMVLATRDLEKHLMKQSRRYAKHRREQNPNLVFSDVRAPGPPGVDILLQPTQATIEDLDVDECKIVLDREVSLAHDKPVLSGGIALDVIHHEGDALWVGDISGVQVGMQISQTRFVGTHDELAREFIDAWKLRWMRHAEVPTERWNAILQFAKTRLPPSQFCWEPMTPGDLTDVIRKKKANTSAGFDGVTLRDLKAVPATILPRFCSLFASAESSGEWPAQLIDCCPKHAF